MEFEKQETELNRHMLLNMDLKKKIEQLGEFSKDKGKDVKKQNEYLNFQKRDLESKISSMASLLKEMKSNQFLADRLKAAQ